MKATWFSYFRSGVYVKLTSEKKFGSCGEGFNTFITSAMDKSLKIKKSPRLILRNTPIQTPSPIALHFKIWSLSSIMTCIDNMVIERG